ncbi:uncharacterized protein KY384_007901 [Bacidia gigantensis]|uniref:uncharacterized protein n=1 Tax=Bacidia gigantensis TaxID=2732470 RepID=UPI001D048B92|nr:uncharacterized protein KY384_007901 [Bacidia gigantensis]KAG8527747.1 hypothetical protein KY384_007901 [Bacidia gigantensis]
MERFSNVIAIPGIPTSPQRHNLLSFLATAQALHLEFLPITWQSARQELGIGATSMVNEAFADLHTSFAFKRVQEEARLESSEEDIYRVLTNEIMVQSYPPIREHQHISQLQGLCWDIETDGKVWPVLLFEKSHLGDLYNFLKTDLGKELSVDERLKICENIGEAISEMHSYNVIHGDLKPENVLVYKDRTDMYHVKVIDFGYSTRYTEDTPSVQVPKSEPWNAPEHDRPKRMWKPSEAKKLDYFSFGFLCLWILFEEHVEYDHEESVSTLIELKQEGKLPKVAQQRVEAEKSLNDDMKRALQNFFESTLDHDPTKRHPSIGGLFKGQVESHGPYQQVQATAANFPDTEFKLEASLGELYTCDYRVRSYITTCLQETFDSASETSDHTLTANIAFQVALCYKLGFGISRDERKSADALQKSNESEINFEHLISYWEEMEEKRFRASALMASRGKHHLQYIDFGIHYSEQKILQDAELQLLQDIANIELNLGAQNEFLLFLKNALTSLYQTQGRWNQAEKILREIIPASINLLGKQATSTQVLMLRLAAMLKFQWQLDEAEGLEKEVMSTFTMTHGPTHAVTMTSISRIVGTLVHQGRLEEAEREEARVYKTKKRLMGDEHPLTLLSLSNLTVLFYLQGRWRKAENSARRACKLSTRVYGSKHVNTAQCESSFASCLLEGGRTKDAEKKFRKAIKTMEQVYGKNNPRMLSVKGHLARTKSLQGQWKEAAKLRVENLEVSSKTLGEDHPTTLNQMSDLASTLHDQGQWSEAEALLTRAFDLSVGRLGQENINTLNIMANLASVVRERGRFEESEKLQKQLLDVCMRKLGPKSLITISYEAHLALTICKRGRLSEAEEMFRRVLDGRGSMLRPDHPDTITSTMDLGSTLWKQCRFDEAGSLFRRVIAAREKSLGTEHSETLKGMDHLALTLWKQGSLQEAEGLALQVLQTRIRTLGEEHPNTLTSKFNQAVMRWEIGDHEQAITLMDTFLEPSGKVLGSTHPYIVGGIKYLETWRTAQERSDESKIAQPEKYAREVQASVIEANKPA